jgi:methionine synthase I (cobalamin-dependent)
VELVQTGATFVGGGCGSSPGFIRAIVPALRTTSAG